jgi:hypothetical protein
MQVENLRYDRNPFGIAKGTSLASPVGECDSLVEKRTARLRLCRAGFIRG